MKRWFLPQMPDVLGLLQRQAVVTLEGVEAFAAWSAGDLASAAAVDSSERAADEVRRELQAALRSAFSTPIDPQDIYELSERIEVVLNGVRNAVQEAEVMELVPNATLAAMSTELATGVRYLRDAFTHLTSDATAATDMADEAIRCDRRVEHLYRPAMSQLRQVDDVREVIAWREMYRRYARLGDAVVRVAERVWYAVVKE